MCSDGSTATGDILYIGQAVNLQRRIKQHLGSNRMMTGLREAPNGDRSVVYCEVIFRQGQNHQNVLNVLENALIAHALAEGNELINIKGTRFASHTVSFTGNRTSESIAPRYLRLRVHNPVSKNGITALWAARNNAEATE